MSNIFIPNKPIATEKMEYDFDRVKAYLKEIMNYGYVEKIDSTVPLKHNKIMQFGRFSVRLDTKYKVFETDVWEDT